MSELYVFPSFGNELYPTVALFAKTKRKRIVMACQFHERLFQDFSCHCLPQLQKDGLVPAAGFCRFTREKPTLDRSEGNQSTWRYPLNCSRYAAGSYV
jgi:hypothetical protein